MTNQYKVTTDDSKSTASATSTCSLSPPTSDSNNVPVIHVVEAWVTSRTVGFNWSVDLTKVQFELRDGVPGVSYRTLRIQLVGLLSLAGGERNLNRHPMFYAGFLLIVP